MIGVGKNISCNPSPRKLREIDSSKFPESLFRNFDVFSCIKNQIELPSEVADIEIQFVKVNFNEVTTNKIFNLEFVVRNIGFQLKRNHISNRILILILDKEVFASVILQLPVEGGYDGGKLHVKYDDKRRMFDHHVDSCTKFYMTVILDRSEHQMEPITRGASLHFVINLKLKSFSYDMPRDLPAFLFPLKYAWNVFQSWIPCPIVPLESTNIQQPRNS